MEWTVVLAGPARKALKRVPHSTGRESKLRWLESRTIHFRATFASCRDLLAFAGAWETGAFSSELISKVNLERRHIIIAASERRTSTTY